MTANFKGPLKVYHLAWSILVVLVGLVFGTGIVYANFTQMQSDVDSATEDIAEVRQDFYATANALDKKLTEIETDVKWIKREMQDGE